MDDTAEHRRTLNESHLDAAAGVNGPAIDVM